MNNTNGMRISIISNEQPTPMPFNTSLSSLQFGMTQKRQWDAKKTKLTPWHSPSSPLSASNSSSNSLKRKKDKDIDFESGLKKVGSNRNKYTMNVPYIQNKDMMLFIKGDYETGYTPNRVGKIDFSTIKSPKVNQNNRLLPKTTKFLSHPYKELSYNDYDNNYGHLIRTNSCFSLKDVHYNQPSYDSNDNNYKTTLGQINKRSTSSIKPSFGFPFFNSSKNKQLLLQLDQTQREMLTDYFDLFNSKSNYERIRKNNNSLNNLTMFLNVNYKDSIPLTFPKCISSIASNLTKGEKNRYDRIIEELLKLKYIIAIEKDNEAKIIKEFLYRHGVYNNDYSISDIQLSNFSDFLHGDWDNAIDMSKTFKEILIGVTFNLYPNANANNDNDNSNQKEQDNRLIEEQFPTDNTKDEGKEIQSYCMKTNNKLSIKNKKTKTVNKVDIYGKLSLAKQKLLYENKDKGTLDIAKDLESELSQLRANNGIKKGNKTFSLAFPQKASASKADFYLTQTKSQVDNEISKVHHNNHHHSASASPSLCFISTKFILLNKTLNSNLSNQKPKEEEITMNKRDKPLSIHHLNERFYYSGLNKRALDIKAIKANKKFTEFIVLQRAKRRIALKQLKDYCQNEDDIIL